jgi:hypothetical protein
MIKTFYEPLAGRKRAGILPQHGFCSIRPARCREDALIIGNGTVDGLVFGDPLRETIALRHERMLVPQWKTPPEAPRIAHVLPQVKRLLLEGKYDEAAALAIQEALNDGYPPSIGVEGFGIPNNHSHYGIVIRLDSEAAGKVTGFARTLDFRSGEAVVHWTDDNGKPASLKKGTLYGARLRSGAIADKLSWDLDAKRIALTVTALWEQEIVVVHRRGISKVETSAKETVSGFREGEDRFTIRLPAGKPVDIVIQAESAKK